MSEESRTRPDLARAAVCGLFCPSCGLYIGTHEDPQRLQMIADRFGVPVEETRCDGCRSERRFVYCQTCQLVPCAAERGLDFCGECNDYPCQKLKDFQAEMPHRIELWENLARIKEVGWEKWYAEMLAHYSCRECGTINSAYDLACRQCGTAPSCEYLARHQDEVLGWMSKMM